MIAGSEGDGDDEGNEGDKYNEELNMKADQEEDEISFRFGDVLSDEE